MADNAFNASELASEEWRDIPGWEGFYQASSLGRIRSMDRVRTQKTARGNGVMRYHQKGKILSPGYNKRTGYWLVVLTNPKRTMPVHVAVAKTFLGARPLLLDVAHFDGNRSNNRASNLQYCTRKQNLSHQLAHGTRIHGEKRWNAKLTSHEVKKIVHLARTTGLSQREIGDMCSVSSNTVCMILTGRTWFRTTGIPPYRK